jgi:hypothetical protein
VKQGNSALPLAFSGWQLRQLLNQQENASSQGLKAND